MLSHEQAIGLMNEWGKARIPFVVLTDFEGSHVYLEKVGLVDPKDLTYDFNGISNYLKEPTTREELSISPIHKEVFKEAFDQVVKEINYGNSFLVNLTFETPISSSASISDIFLSARAKYKIRFKDLFTCFSPETFIFIGENRIRSFPMKGTIDARIPDAKEKILKDPKEMAEHITIVDLIRNDLSQVASNVLVEKFRYVEEIKTQKGQLLQVSSEIVGELDSNWRQQIGTILFKLLPAGSISGAPKPKTIEIIKKVETHKRGFYSGICGLYDGTCFDSGVMIRYIEKRGDKHYYKSGGGITSFSNMNAEYKEYLDKIYVPTY